MARQSSINWTMLAQAAPSPVLRWLAGRVTQLDPTITVAELARRLGSVSTPFLYKIVSGKANPSPGTISLIASVLGDLEGGMDAVGKQAKPLSETRPETRPRAVELSGSCGELDADEITIQVAKLARRLKDYERLSRFSTLSPEDQARVVDYISVLARGHKPAKD